MRGTESCPLQAFNRQTTITIAAVVMSTTVTKAPPMTAAVVSVPVLVAIGSDRHTSEAESQ